MEAALTAVAKGVADKIQYVGIELQHTLNRSYGDFRETLEDLGTLHIDVFGETYDASDIDGRASIKHDVTIAIAVRKRFDVTDQNNDVPGSPRIKVEEIDALIWTTQRIFDYFLNPNNRRLTSSDYSIAFNGEPRVVFNPNRRMLMEHHQFLGLVRIPYSASRDL